MSDRDDRPEAPNGPARDADAPADRFERMLSADLDGELAPEERAELRARLEQDEALAQRASQLEGVDAALRSLAEEPISEQRLAESLASLQERLAADAEPRSGGAPAWRRGWPLGLAAAAALLLYLLSSDPDSAPVRTPGVKPGDGGPPGAADPRVVTVTPDAADPQVVTVTPDAAAEEELVWALGHAAELEAVSELGLDSEEDLEIIEQLELLDFLAARDRGGRG